MRQKMRFNDFAINFGINRFSAVSLHRALYTALNNISFLLFMIMHIYRIDLIYLKEYNIIKEECLSGERSKICFLDANKVNIERRIV